MVSPTPAMERASCGQAFGSQPRLLAVGSWTSEADMARPCQRLDSESVSEVCRWRISKRLLEMVDAAGGRAASFPQARGSGELADDLDFDGCAEPARARPAGRFAAVERDQRVRARPDGNRGVA